jgi:hypothetical protein
LDADHGDVNPSFGAGLGGFVIAHQPPLVHLAEDSAERAASAGTGAMDDFNKPKAEGITSLGRTH